LETDKRTTRSIANRIVVHYHRHLNDYDDVTLWTWDIHHRRQPDKAEIEPAGCTDFGAVFYIDPTAYGDVEEDEQTPIGLLPRKYKSWEFKDGNDRFWHPGMGREIWIVEDDFRLYSQEPNIKLFLKHAYLDDEKVLRVIFSHPIREEHISDQYFEVNHADGNQIQVERIEPLHVHHGRCKVVRVILQNPIQRANEHVTIRFHDSEYCPVMPGAIQHDPNLFYTDEELGGRVFRNATVFRVFSPTATHVQVILYDSVSGNNGRRVIELEHIKAGVWERTIDQVLEGKYYSLRVTTNKEQNPEEIMDPFSVCCTSNPNRSYLTNLFNTDPKDFRSATIPHLEKHVTDSIIYEMHVRDFTISQHSGVKERGKYLGFVQEDTSLPNEGEIATGLSHLLELGVSHVQLLPVQKFDLDETCPEYNWGYMTANFFSPEGWFATDTDNEARISELKKLVKKLHDHNIGVILDVVYNHTGVMSTLEKVAPGYYHRAKLDGNFWNGSGCGNEVFSESPMGRKMIIDSCKYWVKEYNIDGFRFDLMGLIDLETMQILRKELNQIRPGILLYGEPWTGGETGLPHITDKFAVSGTGIGAFNDDYRNALKGEPEGPSSGFVQNASEKDDVIKGIQGSIFNWSNQPGETINYATCHDNLTLWDKLDLSIGQVGEAELKRMQMLTIAILSISQGVMFLHGGCEFFRTKFGHHNSYNAPDSINQVNWLRKAANFAYFQYVCDLINLRKHHPVFRLRSSDQIRNIVHFVHDDLPSWGAIYLHLKCASLKEEKWREAVVLINPEPKDISFKLPTGGKGDWTIYALDLKVSLNGSKTHNKKTIKVPRRSLAILAR